MKNILFIVSVIILTLGLTGCTEKVPPGHVGRVQQPDGFAEEIHSPGRATSWGRDILYLLEVSDFQAALHMNVTCADQLNLSFDVNIVMAVNRNNEDAMRAAFENITPAGTNENGNRVITAEQLYNMYVAPLVDQQARLVVSRYTTTEAMENRQQILQEIRAAIMEAFQSNLVEVKQITVNNLDFPQVLITAREARAQREIEIETERAQQQIEELRAQNQLTLANIRYQTELVEASMIADANRIISDSITPGYLAWYQLRTFSEAASGDNNWGFIPYTDHVNPQVSGMPEPPEIIVDEALRQRIREARGLEPPQE